MINCIVAVNNDWAIGKNGGLLYKLTEDMNFFKKMTTNRIVVCGENTLLSFKNGKPLPNRSTIVLCPEGKEYSNCICIHDFYELIRMLKVLSISNEIFVIGGGMLYKSMLPYYDKLYITKVNDSDKDATVFFPNIDEIADFSCTAETEPIDDNGYKIKFCTYEKQTNIKKTKLTVDDLTKEATAEFIDICSKIEAEKNLTTRAELAKRYIIEHNLLQEIAFEELGKMLTNINKYSINLWQQVYLIERSSIPRNADISWFDRVLIFYNTYIHETNIVKNAIAPNGKKFYFINGSKDRPTKHDCLHIGRGENLPDFYFYDDSVNGATWQKMIKVEHKYCPFDSFEKGAVYYKDHHSYNVNYLTMYKDGKYVLYNYLTNTYINLGLTIPEGLIEL